MICFVQDLSKVTADCNSSIQLRGSGAKIKRSAVKKPGPLLNHKVHLNSDPCTVDSSSLFSRFHSFEAYFQKGKDSSISHPVQSVFLGSDRRYNRYWLFLGPCNVDDPGHRRIYFESSEDGHWEVIDTMEVNFFGFLMCKKIYFSYTYWKHGKVNNQTCICLVVLVCLLFALLF